MVLEKFISVDMIENKSWYAIILGFIFSTIGILVAWWVFPSDASIVAIMFTAIASLPFVRKVIYIEERVEEKTHSFKQLFFRNKKIIEIFTFFFLGIVFSYLLFNLLLPEITKNIFFARQLAVFGGNPQAVGQVLGSKELFFEIFLTNIKILIFCMILSLLYGSGGIIVLIWNASVLGVFISLISKFSKFLSILPYTCLEFLAFFLAAIAGGILSVGIENHRTKSKVFKKVIEDSALLFLISFILITFAAFLETYILLGL